MGSRSQHPLDQASLVGTSASLRDALYSEALHPTGPRPEFYAQIKFVV